MAACSSEEWKGIALGALLVHEQCRLCGAEAGDADDIVEHLLCHCSNSESVAEGRRLHFLYPACIALRVPLLLYSMSHHVATFIWALL